MLNKSYLLDTSVAVAFLRGDSSSIQAVAAASKAFLCDVVLGELYYGAYRSDSPQISLSQVREFALRFVLLNGSERAADLYGELKSVLQAQGNLIPDNDLWIAAIALAYGLTVITRDNHFQRIPDLSLESF